MPIGAEKPLSAFRLKIYRGVILSKKKNKPKFRCKSEAQKKAIAANYARKAAQNKGRTASGKVPQGRTLTTHDKYLDRKAKQPKKERPVVVIEANENNDLAVVQLSTRTGKDRTRLKNYQQGQSYFKHYVEIEDDEGNPIRVNEKFRENHPNMDVSREDVKRIKDKVLGNSRPAAANRDKMDKFRGKEE